MIRPPAIPTPMIPVIDFEYLKAIPLLVLTFFLSKGILKRTPDYQKDSILNMWCIGITEIFSFILFIRYGLTLTLIKGILLLFVCLYASVCDIKTRNLSDAVSVTVFLLGFIDVSINDVWFYAIASAGIFLFMLVCAVLSKNKIGGADIKFIPAAFFVLGASRGIAGLISGLVLSVIGTVIRNKIKKTKEQTLPMIPYLSVGFLTAFFV